MQARIVLTAASSPSPLRFQHSGFVPHPPSATQRQVGPVTRGCQTQPSVVAVVAVAAVAAVAAVVPPTMAGVAAAATAAATAAAADTGRPTGRGRGGGGGSRGVPLPTAAKGNRTTADANGVPLPDPVPLLEATASEVALPTPPRGISTGSKYGTATMGGPVARPVADDETTGPSNRKSSRRVRSTEGRVGGGSS